MTFRSKSFPEPLRNMIVPLHEQDLPTSTMESLDLPYVLLMLVVPTFDFRLRADSPVILSCKVSSKPGMSNRTPLRIACLINNYKLAKLFSGAFHRTDQFLLIIVVMPNVFSHDISMSPSHGVQTCPELVIFC
jgi:hypothetical protein